MPRTRRIVLPVLVALVATTLTPFAAVADPAAPAVVDDQLALEDVAAEEVPATQRADLPEVLDEVRAAEESMGIAADEAPTPGRRTGVVEAPIAFTGLYAELPADLDAVAVRVSEDGETWEPWAELEALDELDGPDAGTEEAGASTSVPVSGLFTTDGARYVQLEVDGDADLEAVNLRFLDVDGLNEGTLARFARHLTPRVRPAEATTVMPGVQPRSAWGASNPKKANSVSRNGVRQIVVHHTAGQNNLTSDCSRSRIISTIKNIQSYHMNANGWNDIGYNVVIDPCGGVWEGRAGGLDRAVVGAHAAGFNTGSTGIAVLGNFTTTTPNSPTMDALGRVTGWKAAIHGVNPTGRVTIGSTSYPTVVGHRDVGQTACPGSIHGRLGTVRNFAMDVVRTGTYSRVPDDGGAAFWDISGSPHEGAIEALVERGVTSGYTDGSFRPNDPINRAQVAAFLRSALDIAPVSGSRFSDFDGSFIHAPAIMALVDAGFLNGFANGTFRPNDQLRREHMAAILQRALDLPLDADRGAQFPDVRGYAGEIGAIARADVTSGFPDGTFRPTLSVTRGQMATFLMNALRRLEAQAAAEGDAVVDAGEGEPA